MCQPSPFGLDFGTSDLGLTILAGGFNTGLDDTILEYDTTGDSYTQIGTMTQARAHHAISVVKYQDFSEWCQ